MPISLDELRARRTQAQRLSPRNAPADAGELLRHIVGVQAQDAPAASLSIRPRTTNLTAEDIRTAREETRSIILTWCMRGTMHLIPAPDARWLLEIFGPIFLRKTRARFEQLGLYDPTRERALDAIQVILSQRGAIARPALRDLLARRGFPTEGQAYIHLMRAAALNGLVCFGPEIDGEQSFALLADWITSEERPHNPDAELARRYLRAYGPATARDLANWSGLSPKLASTGFDAIADELVEVEYDGSPLWMLADDSGAVDDAGIVRLLPAFDTLLLGYASRDWMLSPEHESKVHPGGGIIKPTLVVNGEILGTWRTTKRARGTIITVEPFAALTGEVVAGIEAEAADIGRYLDAETTLTIAG